MKKKLELLPALVRELAQCLPETEGLASALHLRDYLEAERKYAKDLEEDIGRITEILGDYGMGPTSPPEARVKRANEWLRATWQLIHARRAERAKYEEGAR